ncbi:MAG: hypothetical protein Q4C14_00640 [Bacillota bacterium]|nr:hypothetical protein [Bacillota bacterium]
MISEMELKKLSRGELAARLAEKEKENEELKEKLREAEERLNDRILAIDEAGSIAEASMKINGVFEAVQNAAEQYLENIRDLSGRQEKICAQRESESREKSVRLLEETAVKCRILESDTRKKCEEMISDAKKESADYWNMISEKMESFYQAHIGLKELLNFSVPGKEEDK